MGSMLLSPLQVKTHHSVFVYGSLLADEVVNVILKRVPTSSSAVLDGFHRFSIKERVYPAIKPVPEKKVIGKVLFGITEPELDILDAFEDVEYERNTVSVSLVDTHEKVQTHTYVWKDKEDPHLYGDWDLESFVSPGMEESHMSDFVKMTSGFMEELQGPESKPRVETYENYYQHPHNPSMP